MNSILSELEKVGFDITLDGSGIVINPPGQLSSTQRELIKAHKSGILEMLRARELSASQAGNDKPAANESDAPVLPPLPHDLRRLSIRYCIEFFGDEPASIKAMFLDLVEASDDWHFWRIYFSRKLGIKSEVACIDCEHSQSTGGNLGRCQQKVPAPGASNLWWITDYHPCIEFTNKAQPQASLHEALWAGAFTSESIE